MHVARCVVPEQCALFLLLLEVYTCMLRVGSLACRCKEANKPINFDPHACVYVEGAQVWFYSIMFCQKMEGRKDWILRNGRTVACHWLGMLFISSCMKTHGTCWGSWSYGLRENNWKEWKAELSECGERFLEKQRDINQSRGAKSCTLLLDTLIHLA